MFTSQAFADTQESERKTKTRSAIWGSVLNKIQEEMTLGFMHALPADIKISGKKCSIFLSKYKDITIISSSIDSLSDAQINFINGLILKHTQSGDFNPYDVSKLKFKSETPVDHNYKYAPPFCGCSGYHY